MATLIAAIMAVETGGNPDPNNAVGFDGKSYGCLQITDICREDCNRIYGWDFTRSDLANPDVSRFIFRGYIEHYATRKRLGREPTDQDRARIWNGGPNGWRKKATLNYWAKVKKIMEGK